MLTVPSSGSAGNPITFAAYGSGAAPRIAADDIQASWTQGNAATEETGVLFASGLEDEVDAMTTDFTTKSVVGSNTVVTTSTAGTFVHGTKGMKLTFDGASIGAHAYKTVAGQTTAYLRAYVKFSSNFSMQASSASFTVMSIFDSTNNRRLADVSIQCDTDNSLTGLWSHFKWIVTANNSATTVYNTGAFDEVTLGIWHYIEIKWVQGGAGTGEAQFWLDGTSMGSVTNGTWNTYSAERMRIGNNTLGAAAMAGSEVYFDDVRAETSAVGEFSGGTYGYYATQTTLPYTVSWNGTLLPNVPNSGTLAPGTWFWDDPTDRLYVFNDPSSSTVEVQARADAISTSTKSYLVFDGFNLTSGNKSGALSLGSGGNNVIKNSEIHNAYAGINGPTTGGSSTIGPSNNIHDLHGFGVLLGFGNAPDGYVIKDNIIANVGNAVAPQLWGADFPSCILTSVGVLTVEHNVVHDCYALSLIRFGQHGGYFIGGTPTVRWNVWYNNQHYGFKFTTVTGGVAYYNISYNNGRGIGLLGSTAVLYNNVMYGNGMGLEVTTSGGNSTVTALNNNIIANNFYANGGSYQIYIAAANVISAENNNILYSSLAPANISYYQAAAKTWTQWQALGFEANGINADPLLVSSTDFHLQSTSPARTVGANLSLKFDYTGTGLPATPDIGAYQYGWHTVFPVFGLYRETTVGNVTQFDTRH
jgi:hypothetical protein